MAEEVRHIQIEINRVKQTLDRLEHRISRIQMKIVGETEKARINRLKEELMEEYPKMKFTTKSLRLLKLVGTLPYASLKEDKETISRAIAEKYM